MGALYSSYGTAPEAEPPTHQPPPPELNTTGVQDGSKGSNHQQKGSDSSVDSGFVSVSSITDCDEDSDDKDGEDQDLERSFNASMKDAYDRLQSDAFLGSTPSGTFGLHEHYALKMPMEEFLHKSVPLTPPLSASPPSPLPSSPLRSPVVDEVPLNVTQIEELFSFPVPYHVEPVHVENALTDTIEEEEEEEEEEEKDEGSSESDSESTVFCLDKEETLSDDAHKSDILDSTSQRISLSYFDGSTKETLEKNHNGSLLRK